MIRDGCASGSSCCGARTRPSAITAIEQQGETLSEAAEELGVKVGFEHPSRDRRGDRAARLPGGLRYLVGVVPATVPVHRLSVDLVARAVTVHRSPLAGVYDEAVTYGDGETISPLLPGEPAVEVSDLLG